jgi:hypothetical protein
MTSALVGRGLSAFHAVLKFSNWSEAQNLTEIVDIELQKHY